MPAFKSTSMTADMLAFNDIYRRVAENAKGEFVDVWDGFVDENGAFVMSGPDINGQPVRLRSSDGINVTKAGKRKLAFYAEKPLSKIFGDAKAPAIGVPTPTLPRSPSIPRRSPRSTAPCRFRSPIPSLTAAPNSWASRFRRSRNRRRPANAWPSKAWRPTPPPAAPTIFPEAKRPQWRPRRFPSRKQPRW